MLSRRKLFVAAAVLSGLIICLAGPAAADTWDVTAQFSSTTNPLGAWSYGYESSGAGPLTPFNTLNIGANGPTWTPTTTVLGTPAAWKSIAAEYNAPPESVFLHPGYDADTALTVARWTSPISGTINISGSFGAGDIGIMYYYIFENGTPILSFTTATTNVGYSFNLSESVSLGNTIDFVVGQGAGGAFYYGSTPLDATITTVPIPGAIWLLGSGLLGLSGLRRKFKS